MLRWRIRTALHRAVILTRHRTGGTELEASRTPDLAVLLTLAVAQRRLGPISSIDTSTTERFSPSWVSEDPLFEAAHDDHLGSFVEAFGCVLGAIPHRVPAK